MREKIYTINYLRTFQVSPDDWDSYHVAIVISDSMTILEIKNRIAEEMGTTVDKVDLKGMKIGVLISDKQTG